MTYHAKMLIRLVPGALTIALVAWLWLWMFEVLGIIFIALQQGS